MIAQESAQKEIDCRKKALGVGNRNATQLACTLKQVCKERKKNVILPRINTLLDR